MKKTVVCLITIFTVLSFAGLTSVHAYPLQEGEGFAGIGSISSVFSGNRSYDQLVSGSGNAGRTIGMGGTLQLVVNDVAVNNSAKGHKGERSRVSGDSPGGNPSSLTSLVPESGTLMVFGGIAGLFYVRHKKVFKL